AAQRTAPSASASDLSRFDVSVGYSYVRGRTVIATGCCFNMNGGSTSVNVNLSDWIGIVGDFGAFYTHSVQNRGFSLSMITYTFGPRLTIHKNSRLSLYVQTLYGGGHAGGTLYTRGFKVNSNLGPRNAFAMDLGGGLDWNVSRRIGFRAAQLDWLFTKFPNG